MKPAPTTSFQKITRPVFLVAWILRAMFEDAGYALAGQLDWRWTREQAMPESYTSDRDPIWNWERRTMAMSVHLHNYESAQQVNIKFTGEYTGLQMGIIFIPIRATSFRDKFYTFNFASFPNGYPLTPPMLSIVGRCFIMCCNMNGVLWIYP